MIHLIASRPNGVCACHQVFSQTSPIMSLPPPPHDQDSGFSAANASRMRLVLESTAKYHHLDELQVEHQSGVAGQDGGGVRCRQLRVQQPQVPQLRGVEVMTTCNAGIHYAAGHRFESHAPSPATAGPAAAQPAHLNVALRIMQNELLLSCLASCLTLPRSRTPTLAVAEQRGVAMQAR